MKIGLRNRVFKNIKYKITVFIVLSKKKKIQWNPLLVLLSEGLMYWVEVNMPILAYFPDYSLTSKTSFEVLKLSITFHFEAKSLQVVLFGHAQKANFGLGKSTVYGWFPISQVVQEFGEFETLGKIT